MTAKPMDTKQSIYDIVERGAKDAGVFGAVSRDERGVVCSAKHSDAPAFYRVSVEDDEVWISLETEDRWLSGSIEGDLVNTGDKLDELIEEEVVDLGDVDAEVGFEHFRSPEMMYVFRSKLSGSVEDARVGERALIWLLGYEIVLRELGDMDVSEEQ